MLHDVFVIVSTELCQMPPSECSLNEFTTQENFDARSVSIIGLYCNVL